MNYDDELAQDITAYNSLQTEEAKRDFLDRQRRKIAQMTPDQRQLHQAAIAQQVSHIAQQVEKNTVQPLRKRFIKWHVKRIVTNWGLCTNVSPF